MQLSFTEHLNAQIAKANAKIGFLYSRLKLCEISMELCLQIFTTYIQPIVEYGLGVWWRETSKNAIKSLNATFSKYLKRRLGANRSANSAFVHYLTNTKPLEVKFDETRFEKAWNNLQLPHLKGLVFPKPENGGQRWKAVEKVPSYMWSNEVAHLPKSYQHRRKVANMQLGWGHFDLCANQTFHRPYLLENQDLTWDFTGTKAKEVITYCICVGCGEKMQWNHHRYCARVLQD